MHIHPPSPSRIIIFMIITLLGIGGIYATINYSECFPNGCTLFQSLTNGWVTPTSSTSKEIMTPEGCKKVTGGATANKYFIPTKTLAEWNSFKNHLPGGTTLSTCSIDAQCGASANTCIVGNPTGYNPGSCGGYQTWTCNGSFGGVNANCSIYNTPSPNMGNYCTYRCFWTRDADWALRPWNPTPPGGGIWCNPASSPPMPSVDWPGYPILAFYCDGGVTPPAGSYGISAWLVSYQNCDVNPPYDGVLCNVTCGTNVPGTIRCDGSCQ